MTGAEPVEHPEPPSVSVVVCARGDRRWGDLLATVGSVVETLREGDECLLVIDHHEELWSRAASRFADEAAVRVLRSAYAPGLAGARNTGVLASTGDVIAFLDDAVASGDWLAHSLAGFADPSVAAVGSAALPRWPAGGRPAWFPPEYDWVIGCSYRGLPQRDARVRTVLGAAVAFRRDVFSDAGLFTGTLDTASPGCDVTELCARLTGIRPQARLLYRPGAIVHRLVPPHRTTVRYFLRRCFEEGVSQSRSARLAGPVDGIPSDLDHVRRSLPRAAGREFARAARGRPGAIGAFIMIVLGAVAAGLGHLRGSVTLPRPVQRSARRRGGPGRGRADPGHPLPRPRTRHAGATLVDQRR